MKRLLGLLLCVSFLTACPTKPSITPLQDIGLRSLAVQNEYEPLYGMDTLAGARYKKRVLRSVPHGWAIGLFWDTFGPTEKFIKKLGERGTWPIIRVQGVWKDDHIFGTTERTKAIQIARKYQVIAAMYPNVTFAYSPFCEHRKNQAYMKALFADLKTAAPSLQLVNTPIAGGDFVYDVPYVRNEWHHSNPAPVKGITQFSYDGISSANSNIEAARTKVINMKARIMFFWEPQFNLKKNMHDTTPRHLRNAKPTEELIKAVAYWKTPKSEDTLSKLWLWKALSEQHMDVDPRANKPVVLGPVSGNVTVRAGNTIIPLTPSGTTDGQFVYRSLDLYGYQMAEKSNPVNVRVNGTSIGKIDPGYRSSKSYIEK